MVGSAFEDSTEAVPLRIGEHPVTLVVDLQELGHPERTLVDVLPVFRNLLGQLEKVEAEHAQVAVDAVDA